MFKTICIIIAIIAAISWYNDHSSLNQWGKCIADVAHITSNTVKAVGHEANVVTRQDETIGDKASNVVEDVTYSIKN
jgi:uncharacterized protein YoxC